MRDYYVVLLMLYEHSLLYFCDTIVMSVVFGGFFLQISKEIIELFRFFKSTLKGLSLLSLMIDAKDMF